MATLNVPSEIGAEEGAQPFKMTARIRPYAKAGEARRLEVEWQSFLASRPVTSVAEYSKVTPLSDIEEFIPCLMCGCDLFRPLFRPHKKNWEYRVVMCEQCGFMYRNPNIIPEHLHKLYDQVDYNKFLSGHYGGDRQLRYRSVLRSFEDLIPSTGPLRVLDFGCGNGLFLDLAQKRGYEGWGVDLSPSSVTAARARLGHDRVWCGDPHEIPEVAATKFDLITLWSVLAHIPRPVETFSGLRSLLKPGGALLVFTVNANSLIMKDTRDAWNGFTRNHLAFYTAVSARRLFQKAGFGSFFTRPHYAHVAKPLKDSLPPNIWHRYQTSVLEHAGGNMNRFLGINDRSWDGKTVPNTP